MFNNIFRKYDLDNLYIGVVTVYRNKMKKPEFVKVDIPPGMEKVSYVTILNKLNDEAFVQIDNNQCCFYFGEIYTDYSNFPIVSNLMSLNDYYKKCDKKDIKFNRTFMTKCRRKRIIKNVTEKAMVV